MSNGLGVADARTAASNEVASRGAAKLARPDEAGEILTLVMGLRESLGRLDREFCNLRDKMSPVLSPELPAAESLPRMKADSMIG